MAEATDGDNLIFLGEARPGFLDTWVTVVRRDTGRPLGVYTANENRTGAGTLPDDPLVYQLHHVDVVPVDDAGVRDMESPVLIFGWAHYTGGGHDNNNNDDDDADAAAAAALPPYEYVDLQGEPLFANLDDWSRDAWYVGEYTERLEFWEDGCDGFPSLF